MIPTGSIVRRKWGTARYEVLGETAMPSLKQTGYLLRPIGESWNQKVRELEVNLVLVADDEPEQFPLAQEAT